MNAAAAAAAAAAIVFAAAVALDKEVSAEGGDLEEIKEEEKFENIVCVRRSVKII